MYTSLGLYCVKCKATSSLETIEAGKFYDKMLLAELGVLNDEVFNKNRDVRLPLDITGLVMYDVFGLLSAVGGEWITLERLLIFLQAHKPHMGLYYQGLLKTNGYKEYWDMQGHYVSMKTQ